MKACTKCKQLLELTEFNKKKTSKDGLQNTCKSCNKLNLKNHYKNNKNYYKEKAKNYTNDMRSLVNDYKKEKGCKYCSENRYWVLEFHHLSEKEIEVSQLIKYCNIEKLIKEIEKCEVVCANCHKDIHNNPYK